MTTENWNKEQRYKKIARWVVLLISVIALFWYVSTPLIVSIVLGAILTFIVYYILGWIFDDLEFAEKDEGGEK